MISKRKIIIFLTLVTLFFSRIQAQDTLQIPRLRLGMEAGISTFYVKTNKPEMVRESQSYYTDYDYDYHCGFIPEGQNLLLYYGGLKIECSLSKRFAITAGLRFSYNKMLYQSDSDYFLWKISEDELRTNYLKIKNISQKNYYVGVPLSVRFFPSENDYFVRQYFVAGTIFDFSVSTMQDVSFSKESMRKYKSQILEQLGYPAIFHGQFFAGVGLKIGKMKYPVGNIEIHFPVIMFGGNGNSLINMSGGAIGFEVQTTLQIPVFKKNQLIYTVSN